MNNLKKILDNKNIKLIIPLIVLFALLIISFIYLREYKYNNYRNKKDIMFYQYFGEAKIEYEATVSYNKKDVIKSFAPKQYKINYDSYPIYRVKDEEEKEEKNKKSTIILPSEMNIIFPLKNLTQNKIPEFSYIETTNTIHYLTFEDYHKNIDHYVLYDGNNLYFFSDSVTFKIKDEEITLSPLSFIEHSKERFSYYDYETDTYKEYNHSEQVIVSNEFYEINTKNDNIEYFNKKILLVNDFSYLETLKEK